MSPVWWHRQSLCKPPPRPFSTIRNKYQASTRRARSNCLEGHGWKSVDGYGPAYEGQTRREGRRDAEKTSGQGLSTIGEYGFECTDHQIRSLNRQLR
jgi:hypothetical protein